MDLKQSIALLFIASFLLFAWVIVLGIRNCKRDRRKLVALSQERLERGISQRDSIPDYYSYEESYGDDVEWGCRVRDQLPAYSPPKPLEKVYIAEKRRASW